MNNLEITRLDEKRESWRLCGENLLGSFSDLNHEYDLFIKNIKDYARERPQIEKNALQVLIQSVEFCQKQINFSKDSIKEFFNIYDESHLDWANPRLRSKLIENDLSLKYSEDMLTWMDDSMSDLNLFVFKIQDFVKSFELRRKEIFDDRNEESITLLYQLFLDFQTALFEIADRVEKNRKVYSKLNKKYLDKNIAHQSKRKIR